MSIWSNRLKYWSVRLESRSGLYETTADLSNEWFDVMAFAMWSSQHGNIQFNLKKIPISSNGKSTPDYYMINESTEKAVGVVEYKNREGYTFEKVMVLGGVIMDIKKYRAMMEYIERYNIRPVFLVRFKDGLRFISLSKPHTTTDADGTSDRGTVHKTPVVLFGNPREWIEVPPQYGE